MNKYKVVLLLGLMVLFNACTSIPLGTMVRMVKLNPLDLDPQQVVIAVKTPQGLKVRDGDVVIDFNFHADAAGASFNHQFPVVVNENYEVPDSVTADLRENESITIMQLSDEDALTMYNAQQAVKMHRENGVSGAGNIDVRLVSACRNEDFSTRYSKLNVYLKTRDDEPFFLLFRNMDVTKLDSKVENGLNTLLSCSAGGIEP